MAKATLLITLKPTVLDAQGQTVQSTLHGLGYKDVSQVRIGKVIELHLETHGVAGAEAIEAQLREMCDKLLVNPITESYTVDIVMESSAGEGFH